MRKFYIRDGSGTQYDLNGEQFIWLLNPTGLGVSYANKYSDIKQGFFAPLNTDEWQTQSIVCDFGFVKSAYEVYRQFMSWLVTAEELIIVYQPYGNDKFYRRVKMDYIEKTELINGQWLQTPASFTCLTPWYKPQSMSVVIQGDTAGAMTYPFTYDSSLVYASSYNGAYGVQLSPAGHIPAAIQMTYNGAVTEPTIVLTGASTGTEYGRCKINVSASASIVYSSLYSNSFVTVDGQDASNYISPASDPFFHIPLSEPCNLRILSNAEMTGTAEASIYYYYRSV